MPKLNLTSLVNGAFASFGTTRRKVIGVGSQIGYGEDQREITWNETTQKLTWADVDEQKKPVTGQLTKLQVQSCAKFIDSLYDTMNLRDKLLGKRPTAAEKLKGAAETRGDEIWLKMYLAGDRKPPRINWYGDTKKDSIYTIPCHSCGLVLPLPSVQLDHYMPQASGPDASVVKMLRVMGFTKAPPAASGKGNLLHQQGVDAASAGMEMEGPSAWEDLRNKNLLVPPKGRKTGEYGHMKAEMGLQKWTTTGKGSAFLTLFYGQGANGTKWVDVLRKLCLHSKLNLVPLCSHCNIAKSSLMRTQPPGGALEPLNYPWNSEPDEPDEPEPGPPLPSPPQINVSGRTKTLASDVLKEPPMRKEVKADPSNSAP